MKLYPERRGATPPSSFTVDGGFENNDVADTDAAVAAFESDADCGANQPPAREVDSGSDFDAGSLPTTVPDDALDDDDDFTGCFPVAAEEAADRAGAVPD